MAKDVASFVGACSVCTRSKNPHQRPQGLLHPLAIPHRPWSHISMDFVTGLPESEGNTVILMIIDRFSKACRFVPLPKLPSALETAKLTFNHVFRVFGLPQEIVFALRRPTGPRLTGTPSFRPGQRVWLSSRKLAPRLIGPFKIVRKINPVTYQPLKGGGYRHDFGI